jgi:hypothetical protein
VPERALQPASNPVRRPTVSPIHAVPRGGAEASTIDAATAPRRHRQNGMGDVVIPVAHGEIVALPRLWDFDLERIEDDGAVLRTDTGLIAVVTFLADTAVVDDVADVASRAHRDIA